MQFLNPKGERICGYQLKLQFENKDFQGLTQDRCLQGRGTGQKREKDPGVKKSEVPGWTGGGLLKQSFTNLTAGFS